jgi:uncharacterized RDD family membrane protein YckC
MSRPFDSGLDWISDAEMTDGAIARRIVAFVIDGVIVLIVCKALAAALFVFGILTLGLGFPLLGLIPVVPVLLALFNARHRTLHDIASGLVLVRSQALTRAAGFWNMPAGGSPPA